MAGNKIPTTKRVKTSNIQTTPRTAEEGSRVWAATAFLGGLFCLWQPYCNKSNPNLALNVRCNVEFELLVVVAEVEVGSPQLRE